jgi:hypothetical protein
MKLPIPPVRTKLDDTSIQRLIPFLGAGASLQKPFQPPTNLPIRRPQPDEIENVCATFKISERTRRFVEIAIHFAQLLDQQTQNEPREDFSQAPSSWQLATRLAELLQLEPLRGPAETLKKLLCEGPEHQDHLDIVRRIAELMRLSKSVPQLLTVASYFNLDEDRDLLRNDLSERFNMVTKVTPIQEKIATKASQFVSARNLDKSSDKKDDYLIITTNYDQLIERRLQELKVPTAVITVDRERHVWARFLEGTQDLLELDSTQYAELQRKYGIESEATQQQGKDTGEQLRYQDEATQKRRNQERKAGKPTASQFQLADKSHSLAMVYKIHGCPTIDENEKIDNIVISDQDYVSFIQQNGRTSELIPACVKKLALESRFLFLGYSFADWNVRTLYQQFVRRRYRNIPTDDGHYQDCDETQERDYVVLRSYDDSDDYFLRNQDVSILLTELDEFATQI